MLLALVSGLFLIITSVSGVILSFDPIDNQLNDYALDNADNQSLATVLDSLTENYIELIELKVDDKGFVKLDAIDNEGEFISAYYDVNQGKTILNEEEEDDSLMNFVRSLHRSLFAGQIGRIVIGCIAFLLVVIVISGVLLIAKRQLGWKNYFGKIKGASSNQFWHSAIGRIAFPLILIIGFTGTQLSLHSLGFFKEDVIEHEFDQIQFTSDDPIDFSEFKIFKNISIADLKFVQFPFSSEPEDYFVLRTETEEFIINQFNGEVYSQISLGNNYAWNRLNFNLHTGKGSILWSIVLLCGALSILFFIYSGLKITFSRKQKKVKEMFSIEEAEVVILYGSENGATKNKALKLFYELLSSGEKVRIDSLNNYTVYQRLKTLVIFTSTYGNGEAPWNANAFIEKVQSVRQTGDFGYSIVAFGSMEYESYCEFGKHIAKEFKQLVFANELISLTLIDRQNKDQFGEWRKAFISKTNIQLVESDQDLLVDNLQSIQLKNKRVYSKNEYTSFVLEFEGEFSKCSSGDLIAFQPKINEEERFYSIGKLSNSTIVLAVRKIDDGLCSNWLFQLDIGASISGRLQSNDKFHLPKDSQKIIAIANGTGVAPYIGMIREKKKKDSFTLLWGGKDNENFELYSDHLQSQIEKESVNISTVYSKSHEFDGKYVQSLIPLNSQLILDTVASGGTILICGGIKMRDGVMVELDKVLSENGGELSSKELLKLDQLRMDCY